MSLNSEEQKKAEWQAFMQHLIETNQLVDDVQETRTMIQECIQHGLAMLNYQGESITLKIQCNYDLCVWDGLSEEHQEFVKTVRSNFRPVLNNPLEIPIREQAEILKMRSYDWFVTVAETDATVKYIWETHVLPKFQTR